VISITAPGGCPLQCAWATQSASLSAHNGGARRTPNLEEPVLTQSKRLMFASIFFTVFWTAGMYVWTAPRGVAGTIILVISGAVVGTAWHFVMRWWMKRSLDVQP
jgi:hypothetical protein